MLMPAMFSQVFVVPYGAMAEAVVCYCQGHMLNLWETLISSMC